MICPQSELLSIQVWSEMLDPFYHGKQLSPGYAVVSLWRGECFTVIPNYPLLPFLHLREYCSYALVAGVRIQDIR